MNILPKRQHSLRRPIEPLECRQLLSGDTLLVSEFMASNTSTLVDEDGNSSDWIEIHNPTDMAVSIDGWSLTDRNDRLDKWRFPGVFIPEGGYLVVFASGTSRTDPAGPLHTNFKLAASGEYLALVQPERTVAHEFDSYPAQTNDISYGLDTVSNTTGYLASPTPGNVNSPLRGGQVQFSHSSTTFIEPFLLTISADIQGAEIRYTRNGTPPTAESFLYTGPLEISASTQIRASAISARGAPGPVSSASFVQLNADVQDFSSNLPIVVLENFRDGRIPSDRPNFFQPTFMAIFEPDDTGRSALTNEADVSTRAGIKIRGFSTRSQPKPNYALEVWDETDDDHAISILGMPPEADWVLYAPYEIDRSLIRNALLFELSNQMGRFAPRTQFVEVFTNTGGGPLSQRDYHGVYAVMDKIDAGPNRVDVADLPPGIASEPDITGGYILKIDPEDPNDHHFGWFTKYRNQLWHIVPKQEEIPAPQRDYIQTFVNDFEDALYGPDFRDPELGHRRFFDVDASIDFHILQFVSKNTDAFVRSTFLYKDRGGKIAFGPIWDMDRTMGATSHEANPVGWKLGPRGSWDYTRWGRLFEDPDFMQQWIDRYSQLRQDVLSKANVSKIIDRMADQLNEAAPRNFRRWPGSTSGWKDQIAGIKQWLTERLSWMDSRFVAPPAGSPHGGIWQPNQPISLSSNLGDIYYTTDGTDPRLPGGQLRPSARRYDREETYVQGNSAAQYLIPAGDAGEADWPYPDFADDSWNSGNAAIGYDSGTTDIGLRTESGFTVRELQASIPTTTLSVAELVLQAGTAVVNNETNVSDIPFIDYIDNPENVGRFDRDIPFPGGGGDNTIVHATATLLVEDDATYTFGISTDDGARLRIDGTNVIVNTGPVASSKRLGTIALSAGLHTLDLLMFDKDSWTRLELSIAKGEHLSFKEDDFQLLGENVAFAPYIQTDVRAQMQDVNSSLYQRISFQASQPGDVNRLTLSMQYDDGFVAYLNGVEVARRHAPETLGHQSTAAWREDWDAARQEDIDLSDFKSQLRQGRNILAIHGLNATANDGKFLLVPELWASLSGPPIKLPGPTIITARVKDDLALQFGDKDRSPWSPPITIAITEQAIADSSNLRITELNYNPHHPQVQQGERDANNDAFEFVELMNVGAQPMDLGGVQFVEGVAFTFSEQTLRPSERIVVAENVDAFRSRYGNAIRIAGGSDGQEGDSGEYRGRLANGGERIKLMDRMGRTIQQFTYDEAVPWPVAANAEGSSLELIDVHGIPNDPHNWTPSTRLGGTPGAEANLHADFNRDSTIDADDIDLLFREVTDGTHGTEFDLNRDGQVNSADVDQLVLNILKTQFGDANLDHRVDQDDFMLLAANFGVAGDISWSSGDFDGDNVVSFRDFVTLTNLIDVG